MPGDEDEAQLVVEDANKEVQDDVAEVVPERLERMDEVVEAEGEDGEGAVGLVRLLLAHRRAPEVVQEDCNTERTASSFLAQDVFQADRCGSRRIGKDN